jgi:hypothetical protein
MVENGEHAIADRDEPGRRIVSFRSDRIASLNCGPASTRALRPVTDRAARTWHRCRSSRRPDIDDRRLDGLSVTLYLPLNIFRTIDRQIYKFR